MEKNNRIARRNDFFNRFSKTELKATTNWKMGDDILVLRKNKTFRYYSKVIGLINSGYYSGKFKNINDTLFVFEFYKNYKPPFFVNDTLVLSQKEDFQILKNNKSDYLVIVKNKRNKIQAPAPKNVLIKCSFKTLPLLYFLKHITHF